MVFDFFGGTPGFQTGPVMGLPRLLYAFARFERGAAAIHVGQDDMMLAPRNPTSVAALSFPLLFRSGNLYLRVPQARIESRLAGAEGAELRASFGIVSPIGGDYRSTEYTFVPPALGGERSKMPAFQGRVAWQQGTEDRGTSLGVSGHYGRERPAVETVDSWAAAVDFNVQGEHVGVAGEAFVGDNVDQFGGALGQVARSAGGFLEARVRPLARWEVGLRRRQRQAARRGGVAAQYLRLRKPDLPPDAGGRDVFRVSMAGNARRRRQTAQQSSQLGTGV